MIKRTVAVLLMFCLVFTGLPFLSGNLDAHAASKKTAKKITLSAAAFGQNRAVLKWNKIKKPQKGYAVFRDGQPIAHVGKKLSFSDSGLAAGSAHTYQIKVYKTKKVKVWFNKSTGKWQKKKPAKKNRGKSKKVVTYKYQKPSNAVSIRTAAAPSGRSGASASGGNQSPSGSTAQNEQKAQDPSTSQPSTPQYDYNIKFINQPYGNGGKTVVFLETNNPNPMKLMMNATNENGEKVTGNGLGISTGDYADVEFSDDDCFYVGNGIPTIFEPSESGQLTFNVYEVDRTAGTNKKVASRTVNVIDYAAEEAAWRQAVINEVTTSSMTNKEKMQAICDYILSNFKYYPNYNGQYCFEYLTAANVPFWVRKEIDSSLSPAVLVKFGNDLGYPLEDLYNKYEVGTREWKQFHMCVYSEADDAYFKACPPSTTNRVNPDDITKFDPDTYGFWN